MFDYQQFDEKIRKVFSEKELKDIIKKAACLSEKLLKKVI